MCCGLVFVSHTLFCCHCVFTVKNYAQAYSMCCLNQIRRSCHERIKQEASNCVYRTAVETLLIGFAHIWGQGEYPLTLFIDPQPYKRRISRAKYLHAKVSNAEAEVT